MYTLFFTTHVTGVTVFLFAVRLLLWFLASSTLIGS
jgi:hypothetical protein